MKTAEQRFGQVVEQFISSAKHRYSDARQEGDVPAWMKEWLNLKGDFEPAYHLSRTFAKHLSQGTLMTLTEMVNLFHWIFTHFETEEDRLRAWLNAGTIFFCNTTECEENHSHPFSRPLGDILDAYIDKEVERRVKEELRIMDLKKMQEELEKKTYVK